MGGKSTNLFPLRLVVVLARRSTLVSRQLTEFCLIFLNLEIVGVVFFWG